MKKLFILSVLFVLGQCVHAQTWTPLSVGVATDVGDISFPSDDTGFAALGNGTIRKTYDGGLTWSNVPAPGSYLGALEFVSGTTGMMVLDSTILRTTNCGASWSVALTNADVMFYDITFVSATVGYAAGAQAMTLDTFFVYRTLDAGQTWTLCTPIHDWSAVTPIIHFRSSLEGYLTGSDSIFRTTDGGVTWNSVYADATGSYIATICTPDPSTAYACDLVNAEVIKSTNGGLTWSGTSQIMASPAYGSNFINSNFGFMCGGNGINAGYISETVDGGVSWTSAYIGATTFWCMDFPSNTTGYCGGTAGVIMKYSESLLVQDNSTSTISIYPNPASDFLFIENAEIGSAITITNSLGQVVMTETAVSNNLRIDVADLTAGIYFCIVTDGETWRSEKLVVE